MSTKRASLGIPDTHDLERLARGIVIDGRRTEPAAVEVVPGKRDDGDATLRITIHEGRNRQVRKMCDAIGHPVDRLKRVAIGPIRDSRLKPGQWRELTREERGQAQSGGYGFFAASRSEKRAPLRMCARP